MSKWIQYRNTIPDKFFVNIETGEKRVVTGEGVVAIYDEKKEMWVKLADYGAQDE